jgi:hypothetical protein
MRQQTSGALICTRSTKTVHNPEPCLIAVDADDGQMTALETVAQLGQIFELKISVGTRTGGDLLVIDPQRIAHVMEQAGDSIGGDGNAELGQLLSDGGGSATRPA